MACCRHCGDNGCSNCGGSAWQSVGTFVSNALAAVREVVPLGGTQTQDAVQRSWMDVVVDALKGVAQTVGDWIQGQDWTQYATLVATLPANMIGPFPLIIVEQEELDFEGKVTTYPIEDRNELADHIHNEPKRVRLKAVLGSPNIMAVGTVFTGVPILDTSPFWQAKFLALQLEKLQRDRVPVWYVSNLQIIPNVVIRRIKPSMRAPHSNVIYCEIELQEVMFGTPPEIKPGGSLADGSKPQDGGNTTTGDKQDASESFLGWLIDLITGAIGGKK